MKLDDKTAAKLRIALKHAARTLIEDGREVIDGPAIVERALEEAMTTLRRLPDPEKRWLSMSTAWPSVVADEADVQSNYLDSRERIRTGEDDIERIVGAPRPSGEHVTSMEAVFDVFRIGLRGSERRRDWKILCFVAMGMTFSKVGRIIGLTGRHVSRIRELQILWLAKALDAYRPSAGDVEVMTRLARAHLAA